LIRNSFKRRAKGERLLTLQQFDPQGDLTERKHAEKVLSENVIFKRGRHYQRLMKREDLIAFINEKRFVQSKKKYF